MIVVELLYIVGSIRNKDLLEELWHKARVYFNKTLESILLYRFERHKELVDIHDADFDYRVKCGMISSKEWCLYVKNGVHM